MMDEPIEEDSEAISGLVRQYFTAHRGGWPKSILLPCEIEDRQELEELLSSGKRVLADFFMDNCGPCKMMKVILQDFAKTEENLEIVTMELSRNPEIATKYEISTVPYLILFEQGEVKERMLGIQQKTTLQEIINR